MKSIVSLSGPVGAGKTTIAREFIALSSGSIAYIEGDKFWSFIAKNENGQTRHKNFLTIMASMIAAAVPYALADYEVLLDFSIPPFFLDTARKIVKVRDVPLDYVLVRPSEPICAARAAARPEGAIPDYSSYSEFYATFDGMERNTISDDKNDATVIADRIREGLDRGMFRLAA
ncbi:MAG TPA: hypothetical protein VGF44_14630 [Terriglobales bacterium]|jgi:hypothetical protein